MARSGHADPAFNPARPSAAFFRPTPRTSRPGTLIEETPRHGAGRRPRPTGPYEVTLQGCQQG